MSDDDPFEGFEGVKISRDKDEKDGKKKAVGRPPKKTGAPVSHSDKHEKSTLASIINAPLRYYETGKIPELEKSKVTLGGAVAYDLEMAGIKATTDSPILITFLGALDAGYRLLVAMQNKGKLKGPRKQPDKPADPHAKPGADIQ